jgi:uncharacterized protein YndB with AHSA1/START domain
VATTSITLNKDAVVSEIHISAPPERVFKALTHPAEIMRWFNNSGCPAKFWKMNARPGGRYSYAPDPTSVASNGADAFHCHGEILEFDPPRVIAYTWISSWHEQPDRTTLVRWELTSVDDGTFVKMTHSGLADETVAREDYSNGWLGIVANLKKFAEQN